jgi:predicted membrane protein
MDKSTNRRALFGILLVIIGGIFLLDNLGYEIQLPRYLFTWQMLLIVIGVINFISGNRQAGLILLGIGGFFYLQYFDIISVRTFWPLILIIVGIVFILRGRSAIIKRGENEDNFFDEISIFGGSQKKYTSQQLQGGKITNIFGGSELDLRGAKAVDGAVIEIFTMFGGSEIMVPQDWNVVIDVTAILGGFSDTRSNISENPTATVYLKGLTMLGGGEIRN